MGRCFAKSGASDRHRCGFRLRHPGDRTARRRALCLSTSRARNHDEGARHCQHLRQTACPSRCCITFPLHGRGRLQAQIARNNPRKYRGYGQYSDDLWAEMRRRPPPRQCADTRLGAEFLGLVLRDDCLNHFVAVCLIDQVYRDGHKSRAETRPHVDHRGGETERIPETTGFLKRIFSYFTVKHREYRSTTTHSRNKRGTKAINRLSARYAVPPRCESIAGRATSR